MAALAEESGSEYIVPDLFTTATISVKEALESRRLRVVIMSNELLPALLRSGKDGYYFNIDGLPDDAMLVGVSEHARFANNQLTLRFWSASFDEVPEGHAIPELELMCSYADVVPKPKQGREFI